MLRKILWGAFVLYFWLNIILGLIFLFTGCAEESTSVDVSDSPINFTEVYNVLQGKCTPCHNPNAAGGLTWTDMDSAYGNLVGVVSQSKACEGNVLVEPGVPVSSLLFHKIDSDMTCGAKMPIMKNGNLPLTEEEIALIHDWIAQGAVYGLTQ